MIMIYRLIAALLLFAAAAPAGAQLFPSSGASNASAAADPFDRETPRSTVTGLIDALAAKDYKRASNFFDLPVERDPRVENAAEQLAGRLQAALDADGRLQPFAALSNDKTGRIEDDLPENQERVGTIGLDTMASGAGGSGTGGTPILLTRGAGPDGTQIWRISHATIRTLMARPAVNPAAAGTGITETSIAGAPARDWVLLLGIAAASFLLLRLIAGMILAAMRRFLTEHEQSSIYGFASAALPPLSLYLSVIAFYIYANNMPVAIVARQTLLRYAGIVAWAALAWFLLRLVDAVARLIAGRMQRAERRQAVSVITLLRRAAKVVLLAVAAIAILDTFGLDVTTGIAALGIGGIALALGAQKTVENLVGSVTVIVDQPIQVGDFCTVAGVTGTVEDIGMRSTRIRTNARTVVTIPNGKFAAEQIENFSKRDRFLFNPTIGLTYDTTADQMREVLSAVRAALAEDEDIIDEGARARFTEFNASSLDIEIYAYFRASDFATSLAMREELMLKLMTAIAGAGASIAFPTQTLLLRPETTGQD